METPVFWQRPDLQYPSPFDTIFFDIDGVLIRTINSFNATDIAVAEYVVGTLRGLDWGQREGKSLLTQDDLLLFKQAGGYNNDWDMCYLLATLCTARLREWKGTLLAGRSFEGWAALSRQANVEGHGGLTWVDEEMPASALCDYAQIGEIYHEFYWGAAELKKRYGLTAHYVPDFRGFVHNEELLFAPDLFARLRKLGIRHMGLITGRVGPEVDFALEMMEAHCGERWWEVVVPATIYAKPDPRALRYALAGVDGNVGGGLYIGDTGDDLDLILNYRTVKKPGEPDMLVASVVYQHEVEVYQERGADFVVGEVGDVVKCLPNLL